MGKIDQEVVRNLAREVAEIAHTEKQETIRELWARNNNLEVVERPPLVVRPLCPYEEIGITLVCQNPWLRDIELKLRHHLYHHELDDDWVIDPWYEVQAVQIGKDRRMMWGVNIDDRPYARDHQHYSGGKKHRTARRGCPCPRCALKCWSSLARIKHGLAYERVTRPRHTGCASQWV